MRRGKNPFRPGSEGFSAFIKWHICCKDIVLEYASAFFHCTILSPVTIKYIYGKSRYGRLSPFRKAKLLLKKKRYLETLLARTDTQLENLQQMVDNIEFAQIEIKVAEGLKQGNECLETMHKVSSTTFIASGRFDPLFEERFGVGA